MNEKCYSDEMQEDFFSFDKATEELVKPQHRKLSEDWKRNSLENYESSRQFYLANPSAMEEMEQSESDRLYQALVTKKSDIKRDFDYSSDMPELWASYAPELRGRGASGNNIAYSEVAQIVIGHVKDELLNSVKLTYPTLPFGSDTRFQVDETAYVSVDSKATGPNDDHGCITLSPNQVSGDGGQRSNGDVINEPLVARGDRANHLFHPSLPPLIAHPNGLVVPHITIAIVALYSENNGQRLQQMVIVTIPNGLLLYKHCKSYPGLLYPGKDDKKTNELKLRARVSLSILARIDYWRVRRIDFQSHSDVFHELRFLTS